MDDGARAALVIEERKRAHIDLCLNADVAASVNWWDMVRFVHRSLPEIDEHEIDTSTTLFGSELAAPIVISGMTGGFDGGARINGHLAEAAARVGVAMGVGSQRPALEDPRWTYTYDVVRQFDVPLMFGNVGIPQLLPQHGGTALSLDVVGQCMEMIDADLCCLHVNYLQEIVQPEGDHNATGALGAITCAAARYPVIVKETGAGIPPDVVQQLADAGVAGVDIGGLSGTSWSAVEHHRARDHGDELRAKLGLLYWDWGLPTAACVPGAVKSGLPVISTGGLRDGLDLMRALVLGASAGGFARRLLAAADESVDAVGDELRGIIAELRAGMFLLGCRTITELARVRVMISGDLARWMEHLRVMPA